MSAVSPANKLGPPRPLREEEAALVRKLLANTPDADKTCRELSNALVQDMSDGGMGSIRFYRRSSKKRMFGGEIGEGSFRDSDGALVSVTLNADQFGDIFELDLWKVDFSPLVRYPDPEDFQIVERQGHLGSPPNR
jgi:hypothetical protein